MGYCNLVIVGSQKRFILSKVFTSKDKAELYWETWCEVKAKTSGCGKSYISQFEHYLLDVDIAEEKEILEIDQMTNQEIWFKVDGEYNSARNKVYRVDCVRGGYKEEEIVDPYLTVRFCNLGHYYFQFYLKTQHFLIDQASYDLMKKIIESNSFSSILEEFSWTNDIKITAKSIPDFLSGNYRIIGEFIYDSVNNIGDYI